MNENEIAMYLGDRLNLIRAYQQGLLQSPQAKQMAEYLIRSGGKLPSDLSVVANPKVQQGIRQTAQNLGALGKPAAGIMGMLNKPVSLNPPLTPAQAAMLVGGMMLDERNQNNAREQYIQNNLKRQAIQNNLRNMPMEIKANPKYEDGFNPLYFYNEHFINHPTLQ